MSHPKLVFLGFDSMDIDLIAAWADEGLLPNFRALLGTAARFEVNNPRGFEAGSVWPTLYTGVPLSVHGQFDGMQLFDPESYRKRLRTADEFVVDPFWIYAGRKGKRIAVIDVPYTILSDDFDGLQVADWLTHVRSDWGTVSCPPDHAAALIRRYGDNPFPTTHGCPTNFEPLNTADDIKRFIARLETRIAMKTAMTCDYLNRDQWDLFMTVFHDAHDVGHMLWHVHDPDHERHDPTIAAAVGDPLQDIYVRLDDALGEIRSTLGDDTVTMMFSSHGIRAERSATDFLDILLDKLHQAYTGPHAAEPATDRHEHSDKVTPLLGLYRRLVPDSLKRFVRGTALARRRYSQAGAESRRTRPFFELAANHATGGIRINLRGRDKFGTVSPGPEYDALCRRLIADLSAMINAETGRPLVSEAVLTSDIHDGPMRHQLPDILLEWNHDAPIRAVRSPLFGDVRNPIKRSRTGDHLSKRGTMLVSGDRVRPLGNASAVAAEDIAPTIATLLGLDTGRYTGRPFLEAV